MLNKTYLEVKLTTLKNNYLLFQSLNSQSFFVIKTNAYGLGVNQIANFMADFVYGFAVSSIDEAIHLRTITNKPILILSGFFNQKELDLFIQYNFILTITTTEQAQLVIDNKQKFDKIFLKLDTGMSRLGLNQKQFSNYYQQLRNISDNLVLYSHFACSNEVDNPDNQIQINNFNKIKQEFAIHKTSFNNTFGLLNNLYNDDYPRIGIGVYGGINYPGIKNVASLFSTIIATKNLNPGDKVGYDGVYKCKQKTRIGIVAIGYGDGISRRLINQFVYVSGKLAQIIGVVSMDMIAIDLTKNFAKVGDRVEIFGDNIKVYDLADNIDTISYEIFTSIKDNILKKYI